MQQMVPNCDAAKTDTFLTTVLTILLWRLLVVSDRQSLNVIPHTQLFSYLSSEIFTKEMIAIIN